MAERLQKYLAKAGLGSRRFCEELIKSQKVLVNNKIAQIGAKVSLNDLVEYDGKVIEYKEESLRVIMLNKPEKVISSSKKELSSTTVSTAVSGINFANIFADNSSFRVFYIL